jgi:hypothetical protein
MKRLALAVVVGALAVPATAAAAPPVTVATATTPDGQALQLQARRSTHRGVCLSVLGVFTRRVPLGCARPPRTAREEPEASVGGVGTDRVEVTAGMTTARTAALALRFRRPGRRLRVPTSAGPQAFGAVRFYLIAVRPPLPVYERFLSADGHVRAAADLDPYQRPPVRGPLTLARGRLAGHRYRVKLTERSFLDPRPGRPERRVVLACLEIDADGGGAESCGDLPGHRLTVDASGSCGNGPEVIVASAGRPAARFELRLHNGHVRSVRGRPAPHWPGFAGRRVGVTTIPHARRVESVIAVSRRGRPLERRRVRLGHGPRADSCSDSYGRKAVA